MKLPSFMFYPGDWLKDTRALSLATKGAWIDILVALWDSPIRGILANRIEGWARMLGSTVDQAEAVIQELREQCLAEITTLADGRVVIASRRLIRDELDRARERDRKANKENSEWGLEYISAISVAYPELFRILSAKVPCLYSYSVSTSSSPPSPTPLVKPY